MYRTVHLMVQTKFVFFILLQSTGRNEETLFTSVYTTFSQPTTVLTRIAANVACVSIRF